MDKLLLNGRITDSAVAQLACIVGNYMSRPLPLAPGSEKRRDYPQVHAQDRVLFVSGHVWDEIRNSWSAARHISVSAEGYYFAGVAVIVVNNPLVQEWKLGTIDNLGL